MSSQNLFTAIIFFSNILGNTNKLVEAFYSQDWMVNVFDMIRVIRSHWSHHENILAVFILRLKYSYPHLFLHLLPKQLRHLGVMESAYDSNT